MKLIKLFMLAVLLVAAVQQPWPFALIAILLLASLLPKRPRRVA